VQSIIRELRGEKIDIIEYHEDPVVFAEKALQPAKVSRVSVLDPAEKHLEVIVDDSQLSLAIGKKGQNVRLAAKLLGWKIDIKSEEEKRQEVEQQMQALVGGPSTPLERVTELGEAVIEKLSGAGIHTVEELADMTPEQLEAIPGIGPKTVEKISLAVNNYFSALEAGGTAEVAPGYDVPGDLPVGENAGLAPDDVGPDSAGQSGDTEGLSRLQDMSFESPSELAEEGQGFEAELLAGAQDAPVADDSEVSTHKEHPREKDIPPEKQ
jgi:N utilization substance protein A